MFDKIKNFFVGTIQQELEKLGYSIDQETLNKALSNAPQLAQQIQAIWSSGDPDKMSKIYNLIMSAAQSTSTTTTTTSTTTSSGSSGKSKGKRKETENK